MSLYEYAEDKINLDAPHLPARKIIKMRESAGWINTSIKYVNGTGILSFKRKKN